MVATALFSLASAAGAHLARAVNGGAEWGLLECFAVFLLPVSLCSAIGVLGGRRETLAIGIFGGFLIGLICSLGLFALLTSGLGGG